MKNVTISMDEETLDWAKLEAAKARRSLSRWLAERLNQDRRQQQRDQELLAEILASPLLDLDPDDAPLSRRSLYDAQMVSGHQRPGLPEGPQPA